MNKYIPFRALVADLWSHDLSVDEACSLLVPYGYSPVQCRANVQLIFNHEERLFLAWCDAMAEAHGGIDPFMVDFIKAGRGLVEGPVEYGGKDWDTPCQNCGSVPTVHPHELCGPCCFGEADTAGGNW